MQQVAKLVELQAQLQRHKHEMRLNNCKTKTGNGDETGSLLYCLGLGLEPRFIMLVFPTLHFPTQIPFRDSPDTSD